MHTVTVKPRFELTNYRLLAGLTILQLSEELKVDETTVRRWEAGIQDPQPEYIGKLCAFFNVDHPVKLNLDIQFNAPTQSREEANPVYRREFFEYLRSLGFILSVDASVPSIPVDDPNELLHAVRMTLDECWNLHNQNCDSLADSIITSFMPGLRELAVKKKSRYQYQAALLIIEARILQIKIAMAKADYKRRVLLGEDAVFIGEMSGDNNLHAIALAWHANTYTDCYNQPATAIDIINKVLPHINNVTPLNITSIHMELFNAYSRDTSNTDKEATKARDHLEIARLSIPDNPELDDLWWCINIGHAELDMYEGNMHLILAKRFPSQKEYARNAYETLVKATSQVALTTGYRCRSLIHQADASSVIGNMKHFFDCLEEGLDIAIQKNDQSLITKVIVVVQKTPRRWRNEKQYKELDSKIREIMIPKRIRE